MRVKVQLELEVDPAAYHLAYGVDPAGIPGDVAAYLVDLLSYCTAGTWCWTVERVEAHKGRVRRAL